MVLPSLNTLLGFKKALRLNVNRTDTINFGIKGSTVKQFLSANDVPTTWANRAQRIDTQDLYKIASKQTVMVVCHRE